MWPGAPHLALGWLDEVVPPQLPGQPDPQCLAVTTLGKCPVLLLTTVTATSSWHPEQLVGPPLSAQGYVRVQCGCGAMFWKKIICLAKSAKWQGWGCEFLETRVSPRGSAPPPPPTGLHVGSGPNET